MLQLFSLYLYKMEIFMIHTVVLYEQSIIFMIHKVVLYEQSIIFMIHTVVLYEQGIILWLYIFFNDFFYIYIIYIGLYRCFKE